jgi:hypothetical protein
LAEEDTEFAGFGHNNPHHLINSFPFSNLKNSLKSSGSSMSIIDSAKDFHLFQTFIGSTREPISLFVGNIG